MSIISNQIYEYYIQQYRKDIIDKFNIHHIQDLDVCFSVKVSKRLEIPDHHLVKQHELLFVRSIFELFSTRSCGIRKISLKDKLKRRTQLTSQYFLYEFYSIIKDKDLIFNFLSQLYVIFHYFRKRNFHFSFRRVHNKELCVFPRIYLKYFRWIPYFESNFYLRVSFLKSHKSIYNKLLFKFFLKRLKLIRLLGFRYRKHRYRSSQKRKIL